MPNYVAIELDKDKLMVACAKSAGRRFQIHQLFEIDIAAAEPVDSISEKLRSELAQRGISRADGLGIVCRQDAEVREFTVPPAPVNELPDLVRFQARNVFASLSDNWLFDFVPFDRGPDEQQRVLAFAISSEIHERLRSVAEGAGLKLKRILFRPYSLCELFNAQLADEKNRLLIMPVADRFDMIIATGQKLFAARSFQAAANQEPSALTSQIVGESRRTIASTKSSLGNSPVSSIVIGADAGDWKDLESTLREKLDVEVKFSNPLGCLNAANLTAPNIPETPERYAALIGSIVREFSNQKPIVDFLNPRRPVVKKRDPKKILIPLAAVALFILAGVGFCWYLLHQQQKQISLIDDKLKLIRLQNEGNKDKHRPGVDQILAEVKTLDNWQAKKVNWLEELAWISEKMLTADDIIISRFRGVEAADGLKINLNARTTKKISEDTTWKKIFSERYVDLVFGDSTTDLSNKDLPVVRPFTLYRKADVDAVADKYLDIAYDNRDKELDAAESEEGSNDDSDDENSAEPSE